MNQELEINRDKIMKLHKSILVYSGSDGTDLLGTYSENDKPRLKKDMKASGYSRYLSGYRLRGEFSYGVIAFFKERPTDTEIYRRRQNGFKAAKWIWL